MPGEYVPLETGTYLPSALRDGLTHIILLELPH